MTTNYTDTSTVTAAAAKATITDTAAAATDADATTATATYKNTHHNTTTRAITTLDTAYNMYEQVVINRS